MKFGHLGKLSSIGSNDNVARLQPNSRTCATVFNRINIYAIVCSKVVFFAFLLFHVKVNADVATFNAHNSTLHATILLDVGHHFIHDGCGNGKSIAAIRTRLRIEHGVDAHQFALRIDQRTTRIALVNGSVGLDKRLDWVAAQRTSLGANDTCRNGGVKVEGVANSQHPFANFQFVRVANR